jgi:hypothetical protein
MRAEEFISKVSGMSREDERFEELKNGLPLGLDSTDGVVLSQKRKRPYTLRNTCVTGVGRSNFIRRFLITVSCLYEKSEACFFVISPKTEYGELLRLKSMDVTVPYIRTKSDLDMAVLTIKELLSQREGAVGYPHLFIVLDGLEELEDCNRNADLEEYRNIFELFTRREDVDMICGTELMRSIFSGYPGAFVGVGNCLVSLRETGKADVTYVNDDATMSLPIPVHYPSDPSVMETIIYLNALPED